MFEYHTEHLFSYSATLQPPEVLGEMPEGIRVNFWVTGGEAAGPKLRGKLLPVGADWMTLRRDGVAMLDVRASVLSDDGALIDVTYPGLGDLGADGYARFLRGDLPAKLSLRTLPRFRCAHPAYAWLHRVTCFGVGEVVFAENTVRYDVYAIR
jgi:hypothetical protein